jgi:hypothetical protein
MSSAIERQSQSVIMIAKVPPASPDRGRDFLAMPADQGTPIRPA